MQLISGNKVHITHMSFIRSRKRLSLVSDWSMIVIDYTNNWSGFFAQTYAFMERSSYSDDLKETIVLPLLDMVSDKTTNITMTSRNWIIAMTTRWRECSSYYIIKIVMVFSTWQSENTVHVCKTMNLFVVIIESFKIITWNLGYSKGIQTLIAEMCWAQLLRK